MHLLFATSIVPDDRLGSGYEIANDAILGALRRAGVRVTTLGFTWRDNPRKSDGDTIVLGEIDVRTETASAVTKLRWLAAALARGLTFSSAKLLAVGDDVVRAAIERAGPFDAYVLNSVQFAGAFGHLTTDRPTLFVAHNVEFQSAAENARSAGSVLQRLLFAREARLLETLEARLCADARFVFTLSEEDRIALALAPNRSAALPLVTRASVAPQAQRPERAFDAALIGTWTWQPNRVGLEWFLDEVVPHLPETFTVGIAGSVPAGIASAHPGVRFVGRVPDATAFIRSASVVPLVSRGGTGVQLKTIETFELGLPAVATASALRGIDHQPENCIVTDDPVAFAGALIRQASGAHSVDGRAFHSAQRAALDRAVARGLSVLGHSRTEVFA